MALLSGEVKLDKRTLARIEDLLERYEVELKASYPTTYDGRRSNVRQFVRWLGGTWSPLGPTERDAQ